MKNQTLILLVVAAALAGGCSKRSESTAIEPGVSVGSVHSGMTIEQVISQLGPPDNTNRSHLEYRHLGLNVVPAQGGTVEKVIIGHPFAGRTKEGIGIGSSRADVIQAYGTPVDDTPESQTQGDEVMWYGRLGLIFQLHNGKVDLLQVVFQTAR